MHLEGISEAHDCFGAKAKRTHGFRSRLPPSLFISHVLYLLLSIGYSDVTLSLALYILVDQSWGSYVLHIQAG